MAAHVVYTNVLVAALRSNSGASRQLLLAALNRRFEVVVSVPLLLEYESVLKRRDQLEVMRATTEDIDILLSDFITVAREVRLEYRWRSTIKDPKDDMVLETAIKWRREDDHPVQFATFRGGGKAIWNPGQTAGRDFARFEEKWS